MCFQEEPLEKKRILLIGTGGTIASEMSPNGLTPELNTTQLLHFVPELEQLCRVDCIQLCSLDSTNIRPEHWLAWPAPSGSGTGHTTAL